ncbi:unnamed protein product [Angiostrongylus costaricensis]|uniref:Histone-lysine N-methyltransferase n=1 Tax=Angiostrongylus costaricensis TaxID=334426 RepID=A0A0R3PDZ9_ANGCS|nr:unnamed protein product [Angiostrongylus costaricensis]
MDFEYITTSVPGPGTDEANWEVLCGCKCIGECSAKERCECLLGAEVYYCSDEKGFGVRAVRDIPRGTFVCEYVGEILNKDEVERRATSNHNHNYTLTVREYSGGGITTTFVDPRYRGNLARFINHGCEPNLSITIVRMGYTVPCIGLFANRFISAGEEICYDYGVSAFEGENRKKCYCGFPSCRMFLPMSGTASE